MIQIFRRILVPHDFSAAAAAALDVAADLAARHRGTLTVVHAIAPVYPVSTFAGAAEMPVSTLGRTGLAHLVIGSVAEKVVRHSPVPVLTLRPSAIRSALRRRRGGTRKKTARAATARRRPR